MGTYINRRLVTSALIFLLILFSNSILAQPYSNIHLDPTRVPWQQLDFGAKSFAAEVKIQLRFELLPANEVETVLIEPSRGIPIRAARPEAGRIYLLKIVDAIFRTPVTTTNEVWFDPRDAATLGRIRIEQGDENFKKIYRFTEMGVFRHRWEPKDEQETSKPPDHWTDIRDTFYAYDPEQLGCPAISERLSLLYILSAAQMTENSPPLNLCTFGKRQLFQVRLLPQGFQTLEVDFVERRQQAETRRRGRIEALKITLETHPLPSDLDEVEIFSLLGFKDNIQFFIDPASNLPVQLSGESPTAGKVTIKLLEVYLR